MIKFKNLFKFKKKEITQSFESAKFKSKNNAFKLLQTPISKESSKTQDYGKLLIITSRKVGKAHERNLVKRRIKSIYYQEQLYKKPTISLLIAYPAIKDLSFEELKKLLISCI